MSGLRWTWIPCRCCESSGGQVAPANVNTGVWRRSPRRRFSYFPSTRPSSQGKGVKKWLVPGSFLPVLRHVLLHELQAVGGEVLFVGEHFSPDAGCAGDFGEGGAEGFDHQPAVVADFRQRPEGLVPVDVAFAGGGAVVFGDVDVLDALAAGTNGLGDLLLLNVGVERVVVELEEGVVDLIDELRGGSGVVDEVVLESVEVFQGQ